MARVVWSAEAIGEAEAVVQSLGREAPRAADRLQQQIRDATLRLESFPQSERTVPELRQDDFREVIIPPYRMIYRLLTADEVRILAFYHSARRRLPDLT